jgi:MoaA/NifB/PqqE/SkfB family radical SAM enzyme
MTLKILYRGYLTDCNYTCNYCPFSKTKNTAEEQQQDNHALQAFVDWVEKNSCADRPMEILLTPYGEAMVRPWYRQAFLQLSHLPYVKKIAVQTNLSWHTSWLTEANVERTAIWATYHPDYISTEKFLEKCAQLSALKVAHSVGVVGIKEHFEKIQQLRSQLPSNTYLWINAYKDVPDYYSADEIEFVCSIDPHFLTNLKNYSSHNQACRTGYEVVSIEGNGDLYRCHFIKEKRGNIFKDDLNNMLWRSPCTRNICDCHIGYVHMEDLNLYQLYGDRVLERIPQTLDLISTSC